MGTTLTSIHIQNGLMNVAHIGDSRAYLIRNGKPTCLTQDHTGVGDMVRARILSPDKVRGHAMRSMLNRTVGMEMFVQPDLSTHTLQDGDRIVLCCDGVWAVIEDDEFASLATQTPTANALSQRLIDLAIERETDDNVSVVVVYIHALNVAVAETSKRSLLGRLPFFRNRLAGR
jgi:serine/threonine protein phosphatase PrpC